MQNLIKRLSLAFTTLALSACMVGPDYVKPSFDIAEEDLTAQAFYRDEGLWKEATPLEDMPKGSWWQIFEDEELNKLLELCQKNNPSLASAFYSVEQLMQNARIDSSSMFPQVAGSGSFTRAGYDATYNNVIVNNWLTGFTLTWDLDLFGRIRRTLEADIADAQAGLNAYNSLILSMQSKVAISYFTIKQYFSEIALLEKTLEFRQGQSEYIENRLKHKVSTNLDSHRATEQVLQAKYQIENLKGYIALEKNNLAILLGVPPSQLDLKESLLDDEFPKLPRAVPSELLERRPDVAEAQRRVFAANSRIGAAQAGFFPTVSISANSNLSASSVDTLLQSSSFAWGVSPQIYIPIFQAGKIYAQKQVALASHKEALENYKVAVLNAIGEVENALVNINTLKEQYVLLDKICTESTEVLKLTQLQFKSGIIDYYLVTEASTNLLASQREQINIQSQQFQAYISLIASLGGGWKENEQEENAQAKSIPAPYKKIKEGL